MFIAGRSLVLFLSGPFFFVCQGCYQPAIMYTVLTDIFELEQKHAGVSLYVDHKLLNISMHMPSL